MLRSPECTGWPQPLSVPRVNVEPEKPCPGAWAVGRRSVGEKVHRGEEPRGVGVLAEEERW